MTRYRDSLPWAPCPRCGRHISLTKDGRFHSHKIGRWSARTPHRPRCDASGHTIEEAKGIDRGDFVAPGQVAGQRPLLAVDEERIKKAAAEWDRVGYHGPNENEGKR